MRSEAEIGSFGRPPEPSWSSKRWQVEQICPKIFGPCVNGSVRRIDKNGYISTVAGIGGSSGTYAGNSGNATAATLGQLDMLSVDASGNLYISDRGNDLIDKVATNAAAAGVGLKSMTRVHGFKP